MKVAELFKEMGDAIEEWLSPTFRGLEVRLDRLEAETRELRERLLQLEARDGPST